MATQIAITDVDTTDTDTTDDTPERTGEIRPDMPDEEYYALDRVGSTAVREAYDNPPSKYAHWRESGDEQSDAQRDGDLVHEAILEPEKWDDRPPCPPHDPDEMYGKAAEAAALEAEGLDKGEIADELGYSGKGSVTRCQNSDGYDAMVRYHELYDTDDVVGESKRTAVEAARRKVFAHDEASRLLHGCKTELVALSEVEGVPCRAKIDILSDGQPYPTPVDLKTTRVTKRRSAARDDWGNVAGDDNLHVQAALYLMVLANIFGIEHDAAIDALGWRWIIVEKEPPYEVGCYPARRKDLEAGIEAVEDGLETIRKYRSGDRSGYDGQGRPVAIPEYKL
jgi:hypothetical protein